MHGFNGTRPSGASIPEVQSAINVTPFIDVVLVLLIVFMVAAPLSTVSVPLDLPTSQAAATPPPDQRLDLSVQSDLSLSLNEQPITRKLLAEALRGAGATADSRILLRADRHIPYGELMAVLDQLRQAGFAKVALVGLESDH
jgi:biopolymer transport protein ExbD/biopolymer transport protein TolR